MLEAWKTMDRRRLDFAVGFAGPIRSAWLEECHEVDKLPMPSGVVPNYPEARAAFGRARWLGPGRGWIDPVAEREGAVLGMEAALSTLEDEAAEQDRDWEENLDQRKVELDAFKERGLEPPASWLAQRDPNGRPLGGSGQPSQGNKKAQS